MIEISGADKSFVLHNQGGARISAIVRGDQVLIAHHDTVIESEDHVILFLTDKKKIAAVEKLFQVGITYF